MLSICTDSTDFSYYKGRPKEAQAILYSKDAIQMSKRQILQ